MAKVVRSKMAKKGKQVEVLPLERQNFMILGIGLLVIVIGYILMSGNTVESFRQLTLSPILLVLGYCVIIPFGIMYRKKPGEGAPGGSASQQDKVSAQQPPQERKLVEQ